MRAVDLLPHRLTEWLGPAGTAALAVDCGAEGNWWAVAGFTLAGFYALIAVALARLVGAALEAMDSHPLVVDRDGAA